MNEHTFPSRNFLASSSEKKLLRIVFPTAIRLMDDRTSVVQEVPRDLQYFPMILAICVVEDVSQHLDTPFLWILSNQGASSNLSWGYADTASAACPSQPGNLAITSIFCSRTQTVQWKLRRLQSRPLRYLPGARLCLCTSIMLVPTPHFRGDISPSM